MSGEAQPPPLAHQATPPIRLLAWICAIIGFFVDALMIKFGAERGVDFFHRGLIELVLIVAAMILAGGQWLPLLRGQSGRAIACFAAAVGCFIAPALIPWGWQGPDALCLVQKCQYVPIFIVQRDP
ncbi:MAG: hypothetical protein ABI471_04805 [Sphingomonas bacterium]